MSKALTRLTCLVATMFVSTIVSMGCNSSAVKDAIDVIEGVPRKTINTDILGVNAFGNDGRFGSPEQQYSEVGNWTRASPPSSTLPSNSPFVNRFYAKLAIRMYRCGRIDW
jgi:hypothetical protein